MNRSISHLFKRAGGLASVVWLGGALVVASCVSKGDTNVNGGPSTGTKMTGGSLCAQYCGKVGMQNCNLNPNCQANCETNATMCPNEFDAALQCALSTTLTCSASGDAYSAQCTKEFTDASNCLDGMTMTMMPPDPMCNTKTTFDDCDACCTAAYPDAEKKWEAALTNCACTDTTMCAKQCATAPLCIKNGTASDACNTCVGMTCTTAVDNVCGSDPTCKPYNDCFNKCPSP
jgi:hypothetical protein